MEEVSQKKVSFKMKEITICAYASRNDAGETAIVREMSFPSP